MAEFRLSQSLGRRRTTKSTDRTLLRAALKIGEVYERESMKVCPEPPEPSWREVHRVHRLWCQANKRRWNCERILVRGLRMRLDELRKAIDKFASNLVADSRDFLPTSKTIHADLVALCSEFAEIQVELREGHLSVITDPISLEGVKLGPFEIRLYWSRLLSGHAYDVHALEPNPAAANDSVSHPHVQDDSLCEGEGKVAIRAALQQGRLLDFFLLVRQILETYNPRSAYVQLSDWLGVTCSDCGTSSSEDESFGCGRCGCDLCGDCSRSCSSCGQASCSSCSSACTGCDADYCSSCISACRDCGEDYCTGCLTDRKCSSCLESEDDEDEKPQHVPEETTGETIAATAVHALRLGEAGIPA